MQQSVSRLLVVFGSPNEVQKGLLNEFRNKN